MLSEAKHPRISVKRNAETLRRAQGGEPSVVTLFSVTRHQPSRPDLVRVARGTSASPLAGSSSSSVSGWTTLRAASRGFEALPSIFDIHFSIFCGPRQLPRKFSGRVGQLLALQSLRSRKARGSAFHSQSAPSGNRRAPKSASAPATPIPAGH
jgi:hypothetical protein